MIIGIDPGQTGALQKIEVEMYSFFVAGVPVPKGSAKAFMSKAMKFPVVVQDNVEKQKPWASAVGYAAQQVGVEMIHNGPIALGITFYMPRTKSHFGTGKNAGTVKPSAPTYHTAKPDLDKLVRCVKDALTGIAWKDDAQVSVITNLEKVYDVQPGAHITISKLL
jgi:Holliday junction resolvase RusA-like endonuclease